jgi:choline dehydrogenase-like flavoprotein
VTAAEVVRPRPLDDALAAELPAGFVDARTLDDGSELAADVCVVGSGAAGTTLALRLRAQGRPVLLLESGGVREDAVTSSMTDVDTAALPIGPESRQRFLGGTTNSWWGGAAMLEEIDFEPRPWLGVPTWPIDRATLLPYYVQGCRILGVPDIAATTIERFEGARGFLIRTDDLDTATLFWARHPRRFRDLLVPAVREGRGIQAHLFANVTGIVLAPSGAAVDHLEIATVNGRRLTVRPKLVVIACGGIENARLLLASRVPAGRAGRNVVGRYYMDHAKGAVGEIRIDPRAHRLVHPAYWDNRPGRFRLGVRLSDDRPRRDELLNSYVRFHPILQSDGRGAEALRELRRRRLAALRRPEVIGHLAAGLPEIGSLGLFKGFNVGRIRTVEVRSFLEQAPRPENRVVLSRRKDPFGHPLAGLEWSVGDLDRRTIRALHAALDEDLRRRGFGCVVSPLLTGDDDPWPVSRDASHHMGTTRMGTDPSTSVVDPDCRVHGVDNLYVAGSSVFPTGGYANPTLTIVALALRLGDHLAGR